MTFKILYTIFLLLSFISTLLAEQKPNIILIMADDLGYECIGANGSEDYKTPNLDALAAGGARFTNCFANPLCTPSRAKIMTGLYNIRNYVGFGTLDPAQKTFAHTLKENGYKTCIAGKWQLGKELNSPQHFGFEQSCLWQHFRSKTKPGTTFDSRYPNPQLEINGKEVDYKNGEYGPDICSDFIIDFIEKNQNEPFLAYYPMILTHCPFAPSPDHPDYDPKDPGSKTYKGDAKYFKSMVEYMDKIIGKIVSKLEDLKLRENTVIIFTGDNGTDKPVVTNWNGTQVAGAKGSMTDAGTRVPLIINSPKMITSGQTNHELVEFVDIFPTLCDFAKASTESIPNLDGLSLHPSLTGEGTRDKSHVYIWYGKKVLARNKDYMVVRSKYEDDPEFYDVSKPFQQEKVIMTEKHQPIYRQLLSVIESKDLLRPQDLKEKDLKSLSKKESKSAAKKEKKRLSKK